MIKVLQLQVKYTISTSDLAEEIIRGLPADKYHVTSAYLRGCPADRQPVSAAPRAWYLQLKERQLGGMRVIALWRLYRMCRNEKFDVVDLRIALNQFMVIDQKPIMQTIAVGQKTQSKQNNPHQPMLFFHNDLSLNQPAR